MPELFEQMGGYMKEAARDEIDKQINHSWKWKVPEEEKSEIYDFIFKKVSERIDLFVKSREYRDTLRATNIIKDDIEKVKTKFADRDPTDADIVDILKNYAVQVQTTVENQKANEKMTRDYVKEQFK